MQKEYACHSVLKNSSSNIQKMSAEYAFIADFTAGDLLIEALT